MTKQSTTSTTQKSANKISLSPKPTTINFLISYAKAYEAEIATNGQICDFVLN